MVLHLCRLQQKKRRMAFNDDMNREIVALEDAELRRGDFEERNEEREIWKLTLDSERFHFEKSVHESNKVMENRRIEIEEKRLAEQIQRDRVLADERRDMLSLQREMLSGMRQRDTDQSIERVASLNVQKELLETLRMLKKS